MSKSAVIVFLLLCVLQSLLGHPLENFSDSSESLGKSHLRREHRRLEALQLNGISDHEKNRHVEYHKDHFREERKRLRSDGRRSKRQFDLMLSADHEENVGTDLSAELGVNLWKNEDATTRLDGSANYNRHFGVYGNPTGNARYGAKLTLHHNF
uniref:Putative attacin n=1 Tax=Phlebotomus kandelakii TaxID=1109342 RepID=A0A6B2E7E7_9DIPT